MDAGIFVTQPNSVLIAMVAAVEMCGTKQQPSPSNKNPLFANIPGFWEVEISI
jgi:hypothetical protein